MKLLKIIFKWILSFKKNDNWEFEDYPTDSWEIKLGDDSDITYGAGIINWTVMVGRGETVEKATKNLKDDFIDYKSKNNKLPRPGSKVPLEFASTQKISHYENVAVRFFEKVLEMNYYDGFYSDESRLEFFESYEDDKEDEIFRGEVIKKTLMYFNVDISEIYNEPLYKIFDVIEKSKGMELNSKL